MLKSHFWKAVAVTAIIATMYLAHGLSQTGGQGNEAHAADPPKAEAKMPMTWVSIGLENDSIRTKRAKVEGGWLVYVHSHKISGTGVTGLTFVPDADHAWQP